MLIQNTNEVQIYVILLAWQKCVIKKNYSVKNIKEGCFNKSNKIIEMVVKFLYYLLCTQPISVR